MKDYPSLPNPYIGYLFSVIFVVSVFNSYDKKTDYAIQLSIVLLSWIYYLYVVYTLHEDIQVRYNNQYKISPLTATLYHIIPFYNVYWLYKWTESYCTYVNTKENEKILNRYLIVLFIMSGPPLAKYDFVIAYTVTTTGLLLLIKGTKVLIAMPEIVN